MASKNVRILLVAGSMLFVFCCQASAGNREMVEERVQDLDELNRQAVQQIPELPVNGKVELIAHVSYKDGAPVIDIYSQQITSEKEEDISLHQGDSTHLGE